VELDWEKKIEDLCEGISLKELTSASARLTELYQSRVRKPLSSIEKMAYLVARFPATFAVNYRVFEELQKWVDTSSINSLLDLGSGPGTALMAALSASMDISQATLYERDKYFIEMSQRLLASSPVKAKWIHSDMRGKEPFPSHDLVIASYSLNELQEEEKWPLIERLWQATTSILILIEPGTSSDFESLKKIRRQLIARGGYLVAPCPHAQECPLSQGDWCHFGTRLERSSWHRKVKGGELNYEDEKYFYLIFSKIPQRRCQARVIKRTLKGKGFIKISLCKTESLENFTATKKNKDIYISFKKMDWGDSK